MCFEIKTLACHVFVLLVAPLLLTPDHAAVTYANEISSADLAMDGSSKPPGDRIDISVVLYPEVRESAIEVVAYLVRGSHNEEQTLVMARGDTQNKDAKGRFWISMPIVRAQRVVEPFKLKDGNEKTYLRQLHGAIVIPYADLAVQAGKHRLGYEIRLIADGRPVDAVPTSLTIVDVSNGVRNSITHTTSAMVPENRLRQMQGWHWTDDKLVPVQLNQVDTAWKPVWETRTTDVMIKGEFRRDRLESVAGSSSPSERFVPESKRTVYFATNREVIAPLGTAEKCFGNESVLATDKMSYGSCVVSIPVAHHRPGDIEQPGSWWYFWSETPDPDKHFLIQKSNRFDGPEKLMQAIGKSDVLVYVHGYDNTFKDSILRSAQLNHDLELDGRVVAFSWPSAGEKLVSISNHFDGRNANVEWAYSHDEELAKRSHPFLAALLGQLLHRAGADGHGKVHVLAHSMGNRVLLKAIHDLASAKMLSKDGPRLGQVILAAADIDGATYSDIRSELMDSCERVNYYFATDDGALTLSRIKHIDKPIGLGPVFDKEKMDTISADGLTSIFNHLGHSYVQESTSLLTDIRLILSRNLPPHDRRPPLGPRIEAGDLADCFYWTFQPVR